MGFISVCCQSVFSVTSVFEHLLSVKYVVSVFGLHQHLLSVYYVESVFGLRQRLLSVCYVVSVFGLCQRLLSVCCLCSGFVSVFAVILPRPQAPPYVGRREGPGDKLPDVSVFGLRQHLLSFLIVLSVSVILLLGYLLVFGRLCCEPIKIILKY